MELKHFFLDAEDFSQTNGLEFRSFGVLQHQGFQSTNCARFFLKALQPGPVSKMWQMWLTRPVRSSPEHKQKQSALASERGFVTRQVQSVQKPTVCDCDSFIWDVFPSQELQIVIVLFKMFPLARVALLEWQPFVSILFCSHPQPFGAHVMF